MATPLDASEIAERIAGLASRFTIDAPGAQALHCVIDSLVQDPRAPTSVRDPGKVIDDHLADSLVALELEPVVRATTAVDIGAGAGLPGLPLAIALPRTHFVLAESVGRKCAYLRDVVGHCAMANVEVANVRVEAWPEGHGRFDLVTARALASSPVVLEYAAPLLALGGSLVAWRGRRDRQDEAASARAAETLGMQSAGVHKAHPYREAEHRHLYVWLKVMETPSRFPRRPGLATKRPLGGAAASDRGRR